MAFLDGQLHVFQSVWDDAKDGYADEFDLMPIDKGTALMNWRHSSAQSSKLILKSRCADWPSFD